MGSDSAIHFAFFFLESGCKVKSCTITFLPDEHTVHVYPGITLLEAAAQAGLSLYSPCGGSGVCRKCRVFLEPSGKEVLACQYGVYEDLTVTIPPESRPLQGQILEHGIRQEQAIAPRFQKYFLFPTPASLSQTIEYLAEILSSPVQIHPDASISDKLLNCQEGITAVLVFEKDRPYVLCFEQGDTTDRLYGIAADIGTTTLVLYLMNLKDGRLLQTASAINPQTQYGDDIIGRIFYAQTPEGLNRLQQCLTAQLNKMINELCRKQGIFPDSIYEITAVGNTTMNHLLLGYPVHSLGQAPYCAYSLDCCDKIASQAGLHIHPVGRLYTVENVAGFVGSDTVAAALSAGMDSREPISLLVDIGTNGELVLGNKNQLLSASCAAGPALEGGRILYGSRAQKGAVQRVLLANGDIVLDVIGTEPPRTICGSGLIDAVAVMLEAGILTPTGAFGDFSSLRQKLPPALAERLIRFEEQPAFVLAWQEHSNKPAVLLTQKDIRQIQLAKAAIYTGIVLLLQKMEITIEGVETIFLAGAFGNYIQKGSAIRIGLLPVVKEEKIRFIGNAAGSGAQMILLNRQCRQIASELAGKIEYIEIARQPAFQDIYTHSMLFE